MGRKKKEAVAETVTTEPKKKKSTDDRFKHIDHTRYKVKIRLVEDMLGTTPKDKELYKSFVASKAADLGLAEEELESVESLTDRGWTGYHKDEDGYFLFDYQLKGFLKESARTLKQFGLMKQLQDKVARYCFVTPRKIRLPEIKPEPLSRPLRAQTAQGQRVALVQSDVIAAGTEIDFELVVVEGAGITEGLLQKILAYGQLLGLAQWRSGGYGRFEVLQLEEV